MSEDGEKIRQGLVRLAEAIELYVAVLATEREDETPMQSAAHAVEFLNDVRERRRRGR